MSNGLKLTISSSKKIYKQKEPLNIEMELSNVGDEKVKFIQLFTVHWDIDVSFKSQETAKEEPWLPPPHPPKGIEKSAKVLMPGKSIHRTVSLDSFLSDYPKGGKYSVILTYRGITKDLLSGKSFNSDIWGGTVKSNEIEIEITGKDE